MSSSGLTRRRGAAAGSSEAGDGSSTPGRANSSSNFNDGSAPETSYESGENGHKIAFDPRDISESAERSKQPKLTLMEEVLLLGLKDKQVRCIPPPPPLSLAALFCLRGGLGALRVEWAVANGLCSQGYLSFWNDNISYALRGCIVLELAFRGRVAMQNDPSRRRFPLPDRVIEVIDDTLTGEVLLDEALKMMKSSEKMSVSAWIDLMSGRSLRSPRPSLLPNLLRNNSNIPQARPGTS